MKKEVRIYSESGEFLEIRDFPRVPIAGEYVDINSRISTVWRVYFPSIGIPRIQLDRKYIHSNPSSGGFFE